jgi:homoserine kinase type II
LTDGRLDNGRGLILFDSYEELRPLTSLEYHVWPVMLRTAALRFWLSRLQDWYFPRPGELTHIKNPLEFRDILLSHIYSQQLAMNLELLTSDSE